MAIRQFLLAGLCILGMFASGVRQAAIASDISNKSLDGV